MWAVQILALFIHAEQGGDSQQGLPSGGGATEKDPPSGGGITETVWASLYAGGLVSGHSTQL